MVRTLKAQLSDKDAKMGALNEAIKKLKADLVALAQDAHERKAMVSLILASGELWFLWTHFHIVLVCLFGIFSSCSLLIFFFRFISSRLISLVSFCHCSVYDWCFSFARQDAASAAERAGLGSSLTGSLSSSSAAALSSSSSSSALQQQQQQASAAVALAAADAQRKLKAAQVQLAASTERTQALEASLARAQTAAAADKQVRVFVCEADAQAWFEKCRSGILDFLGVSTLPSFSLESAKCGHFVVFHI